MESLPRHDRTSIAGEIAAGVSSIQPATAFHKRNMSFDRIRGWWGSLPGYTSSGSSRRSSSKMPFSPAEEKRI